MIILDVSVVITALPEHPRGARLLAHRPVVGAERLHPDLRRPAAARRPRRRHPRPPPRVHGRHRAVHHRLAARRPGAVGRPGCSPPAPLQGVGAAIAAPSTLALLMTTFAEGAERTRALALYSAVAGGGGSIGLVLGGMLTDWVSWRWGLFINVPVGIALVALAAALPARDRRARSGHFDLAGAVTSTLGMTALVYGFVRAASDGWGDTGTVASFAAGAAAARGLRRDRAPRRAADHAAAPVREPRALRRLRRPRPARRRHVLDVLLPHPVPAGRARLQRAAGRPRVPADDGRDVRGRPRRAAATPRASATACC